MFPPIHKSTNGLATEWRGFFNDNNRKQLSPKRNGYPQDQINGALPVGASSLPGLERVAERIQSLERENDRFREELQHLRHFSSNNQQRHENDKLSVAAVAEDLQRLANSFNSKLQADAIHQQREQQKAALLFAEVARIGHRVEGFESDLRGVVDETQRKFEAQEQHAHFMATVNAKQQQSASPTRNTDLQRQLRDMQEAMLQLRTELDADRNARWKNDAAVDAKLDSQLERLNAKVTADKRELVRALDEQRQLVTGADFQRVTSLMREFSRVNDHLLALERWIHTEFGQIKRIFQSLAGDVDGRFQCVIVELTNSLKMWYAALARHEEEQRLRFRDLEEATQAVAVVVQRKLRTLEEATQAVAVVVQRKLRTLEEVVPLEVQARQKNDDKLRKRVEAVVKSMAHAIETCRGEYLPQYLTLVQHVQQLELQSISSDEIALAERVNQLELAQHATSDEVNMQHNAMRETIQAFMEDSDAMLVRLAAAVELERTKGTQLVSARASAPQEELTKETKRIREDLNSVQSRATFHEQECHQARQVMSVTAPVVEELVLDTKRIREELNSLQSRTALHEQECHQARQTVSVTAPAEAPVVETTQATEAMRLESEQIKEELKVLQNWIAMHAQESCRHPQAVPAAVSPLPPVIETLNKINTESKNIKEEVGALQAWTLMHAQECRQFFDFLNWLLDDARRESAVMQCLDNVIDQIVETRACGHLNALGKNVNLALKQNGAVPDIALLTAATTQLETKRGRSNRKQFPLHLPDQGTRSPVSENGSDRLDLSTTYYASTDGEFEKHGIQVDQFGEDICGGNLSSGATESDTYVRNEALLSVAMSKPQLNLSGNGNNSAIATPSNATYQAHDIESEEEYSIDMAHEEEIKSEQPVVAHSSPVGRFGNAGQQRSAIPLAEVRELNEEDDPMTLDL